MEDKGYYLYAISKLPQDKERTMAQLCSGQAGIDIQHSLELMPFKGLCAFTSKVSLIEFGQDFKDNVSNLEWLERQARTHDGIVRFLSSHETIVPVRFGTVFRSPEGIETFIDENYIQLEHLLQSIDGCCEMGLTIYFDKPHLLDRLRECDDEIKVLLQKVNSCSQGAGYMLGKKVDQLLELKFKLLVEKQLAVASEALGPVSRAIKQGPLNPDRICEEQLYSNLACLVLISNVDNFHLAEESLRESFGISGMTTRATGPWPAYSFSQFAELTQPKKRYSQHAS